MIARIIFAVLIFLSAIVEATLLPFPLVFLICALFFIFFESASTEIIIFLGTIFLDLLAFHILGFSAIFLFLFFLLLVSLEKLFSLSESWALALLIIVGVEVYRRAAGYPFVIGLEALLLFCLMGLIVFERRHVANKKGEIG